MGCCEIANSDYKQTLVVRDNELIPKNNAISTWESSNNHNKESRRNKPMTSGTDIYDDCLNNETSDKINLSKHRLKDSNYLSNTSSIPSKRLDIPRLKELKLPEVDVPDHLISTRKKLILTVIEGKFLSVGTQLVINAGGLEGSERMARDGLVLFGNKPTKKGAIPNDFNFPNEERIGEKHFQIKYFIEDDTYFAKDLYGSGLFTKIKEPRILKNNSIFSFVTSHIMVKIPIELNTSVNISNIQLNPGNDDAQEASLLNAGSKIHFRVIYGVNKGKEYVFYSARSPIITFGRTSKINDSGDHVLFFADSISRLQSTVFYKDNNWYVMDSDGGSSSMNGTWCLVDEFFPLENEVILRAGTTSFECTIKYQTAGQDN